MAADEDAYPAIARNAVNGFTYGYADFVEVFGPWHRRCDAVGQNRNDGNIHLRRTNIIGRVME